MGNAVCSPSMPGGAWSKGASLDSGACGRVVGRHRVDGAVAQAGDDRRHVLVRTQRRVHLEDRVVARHRGVGQQHVVRRGLGRDREAFLLGPADQVDGARRGQVEEVHRCARQTGQRDVAGHHGLLGGGRHAGDAEPARPGPLVHGAPGRETRVLAVLGQRDAEALGVVECTPHERAVLHARAVVGEERHAERGQLAERGQTRGRRARR